MLVSKLAPIAATSFLCRQAYEAEQKDIAESGTKVSTCPTASLHQLYIFIMAKPNSILTTIE